VQGAQWFDPQKSSNIERLMGEFSINA